MGESDEVLEARRLDRAGRAIEVLVVVKAAPQPSRHYGDTVSVAAIALDPLRWVRLYPVPFRYLDDVQQFKKYDIVQVSERNRVEPDPPKRIERDTRHADRVPVVPRGLGCRLDDHQDLNGPSGPIQAASLEDLVTFPHDHECALGMLEAWARRPQHAVC